MTLPAGWTDDLPLDWTRYPLIQQVPAGRRAWYVIVSRGLVVMPTHWVRSGGARGQCIAHVEPSADCEGCMLSLSIRHRPFLGVIDWSNRKLCVLELTAEAVTLCPEIRPKMTADLRGHALECWRDGPHVNAPVRCALRAIPDELPEPLPEIEVTAVLMRRFNLSVADAAKSLKSVRLYRDPDAV